MDKIKESYIDKALNDYLAQLKKILKTKIGEVYKTSPIYDTPDFDVHLNFGEDNYYFYMKVQIDGKTKLYGGEYGLDGIEI